VELAWRWLTNWSIGLSKGTLNCCSYCEQELEQMHRLKLVSKVERIQERWSTEVRPRVCEDGDNVSLQFQIGEIQSAMLASDPDFLVLSYTRTMTAFRLFYPEPTHIAMIGLGGGSLVKWCYRHLPTADITVIEINPRVIDLREQFLIPADDNRLRVIHGDGADYVASTKDSPDVLLVDGFDVHGQPPQLCSEGFYADCYRMLAADGMLVVNLCDHDSQQCIDRIRKAFDDRALIVTPEDGENQVVFAAKGQRSWVEDARPDELAERFQADYVLSPSVIQN
jgi:spermidine synthase